MSLIGELKYPLPSPFRTQSSLLPPPSHPPLPLRTRYTASFSAPPLIVADTMSDWSETHIPWYHKVDPRDWYNPLAHCDSNFKKMGRFEQIKSDRRKRINMLNQIRGGHTLLVPHDVRVEGNGPNMALVSVFYHHDASQKPVTVTEIRHRCGHSYGPLGILIYVPSPGDITSVRKLP